MAARSRSKAASAPGLASRSRCRARSMRSARIPRRRERAASAHWRRLSASSDHALLAIDAFRGAAMVTRRTLLAAAVAATLGVPNVAAAYPDKPIRVIIPVVAGGSTDLVARLFQATIDRIKALPQPMAIVNNGAAGGVVGTRMIKDAEPDGHTIGVWHMGLLTAPAMGVVEYDHTAYELIGQIGAVPIGLAVKTDSPIKSVTDLIAAAKARPGEVTAAMNVGLLPHFVPLMLAHETGVKFRFVQSG
ncbi:MAG: hypothetical protein FJX57_17850, partial [Alphaproteobacteria bacterium]|nr:hypothetical protein [Alphaproteobacteria bacterium]